MESKDYPFAQERAPKGHGAGSLRIIRLRKGTFQEQGHGAWSQRIIRSCKSALQKNMVQGAKTFRSQERTFQRDMVR